MTNISDQKFGERFADAD